jgi:hypothetical protein
LIFDASALTQKTRDAISKRRTINIVPYWMGFSDQPNSSGYFDDGFELLLLLELELLPLVGGVDGEDTELDVDVDAVDDEADEDDVAQVFVDWQPATMGTSLNTAVEKGASDARFGTSCVVL